MNRLGSAPSAYLHSAAHQPVHWYPWSDEAFAAAQKADRPILLDIGAVWCHWCHVMDGESYEDPALAGFLNQNFIAIKVDRDERPDVDARYQRAVQAFSGQGGWPLTGFLTPKGEVFYGGTYFPPDGKYGRPGFRSVLEQVLGIYRQQQDRVVSQSEAVQRIVAESLDETASGAASDTILEQAIERMKRSFDFANGGFGNAPKFPHPAAIALLLRRYLDQPEPVLREMIEAKLDAMARGGIHDHLGGGFHRYSTDARWIVPHFEKMSYDNSELLKAYLDCYAAFGNEEFGETARGIVRFVREVLADAGGGYAASQDADVGLDDDGDYFTWTLEEAQAVLSGSELDVATTYYDIGTAGEMHHNPGKNVLYVSAPLETVAIRLGIPLEEVMRVLPVAAGRLRAARAKRTAPFVDPTRYTSWNAMLASALLAAGAVLIDDWARENALGTLRRIQRENTEPDVVGHTPGGAQHLLDDQVQVANASLDAWEATGDSSWLAWSIRIMQRVWRDFWDPAGGGFFDSRAAEGSAGLLPLPSKLVQDAPTPSPNGVAGIVLARLAEITGDPAWQLRRDELVRTFAGGAADLGLHGATFLIAMDWTLRPPAHFVIVGPAGDPEAERMHRRALGTFLPRRVVLRVTPESLATTALPPAVRGMIDNAPGSRAYACVGTSCRVPVTNDTEWKATLDQLAPNAVIPAVES
ncbi:MAG: thioredoxin domain-containing protein [Gemmatimonadota bacterium]